MKDLDFLLSLAAEAEEIVAKTPVVAKEKGVGDVVTTVDTAVEKHIISRIREAYPDFDIVSEEFGSANRLTDNCFVVDPIDGTANFAGGQFNWGVQIAVRRNGKTVASVVDLPAVGELYFADETGAYLNGKRISVSAAAAKNAPYTIDGWGDFDKPEIMKNVAPVTKRFRDFGAISVSFAALSKGATVGHVFLKDNPWDIVPGLFLAEMAGAKSVWDKDGFLVAANSEETLKLLHNAVKKTL